MNDSVSHLAGISITIGTRTIQRCSICGYKLNDFDSTKCMVMSSSEEDNEMPQFKTGAFIRQTGENPIHSIMLRDEDLEFVDGQPKVPNDCCINLVEGEY